MTDTKSIHIADYNYDLPDERIAKFPLAERDSSKLLVYRHGTVSESVFRDLPSLLPQGALMVFNNTKVIPARLLGEKEGTGAAVEILLLKRKEDSTWTLPAKKNNVGHRHPNTIALEEVERIFVGMGYEVVEGPEVEYDYYYEA